MSYRIIFGRSAIGNNGIESAYILDEAAGHIVAEVRSLDGCRPLVELANRAAVDVAAAAKKRTEAAGRAAYDSICVVCGHPKGGAQCQKAHP